ncbi:hypothetical protein BG015_004025 [Linnemannia schmuckeri]|uniref:polynucleotide adenylyltransferase n=1 Tax=Linnemannia schmuckeri TaxID=64567 RepID=A0A9P5S1U0_9FUNG|nr:hypothetical protein BG015_004025 [Linnemannia schmuckeri]
MAQPASPPHHHLAAQARTQGSPMPTDDREQTTNNTPQSLSNGQGQSRIPGQGFGGPQPASPWLDPSSHTPHLGRQELNHNQNSPQQSHSPFPPPFLHPNLAHLMQQTHMQQVIQQQHQQLHDPSKTQPPGLGGDSFDARHPQQERTSDQWNSPQRASDKRVASTSENPSLAGSNILTPDHRAQAGSQQAGERHQFPVDRHSMDAQLRQGMFHPLAQHPQSMFPGPPGFEGDFGPPGMIPMQTPNGVVFVPMNRVTPPPPGFGHFPAHSPDQERLASHQHPGPQFQPTLQQQQHFHQQQMFMHQQMLRQQHQLQQMYQFQNGPQHPLQQEQQQRQQQMQEQQGASTSMSSGESGQEQYQQQNHQIKNIESHINQLLFQGGGTDRSPPAPVVAALDGPRLTVQEIEEAQIKDLQGQFRRFSLGDPVSPPRSRSIPSVSDHISGEGLQIQSDRVSSQTSASSQQFSTMIHSRFQDPSTTRYEQPVDKAPFSVKDIDFYSDRKYDPYRPTSFDQITRDAKDFCQELMPKPEEETRKLALLQKLSDIAVEVFGEAEVLPFGSSGNGLALANADMDVCVFLNPKEGSEDVSPVEFVERIGDRLEKDPDFENILQLKRARVPIVKLNHVNGIACDIGYQNDLAIWNTRLLRAYCRVDERVRDIVVIIKIWAKRRKINNPYTGSLSSYAYVLLVIHVLQRQGVLPNLQTIVAANGKVPFWDCQGFNRYFFEDIPNLSHYWQPTPESQRQSIGELLYEFFRYYASEFRYANHVVSIRSGGLLTKEAKEWTKDHTQPPPLQQQQQQQQQTLVPLSEAPANDTEQAQSAPAADSKPVVKNRYLFCIEDPFELNHNVGRPVDRYSLFTIRGEFMRAAKILSRKGDGVITRLCVEREVPQHQERNRNGSVDQGDDQAKDRQRPSSPDSKAGSRSSFSTGEERPRVGFHEAELGNDTGSRKSSGRRNYYKRATIGSEPRHFNRS